MPKDMSAEIRIEATAGKPVELPSGQFIADAQMTHVGMDLVLTGADGHVVVVQNYFAQSPAPDLVTPEGARLSPSLVASFVPPEHASQYADSGQVANDASPAGKISEVVGEAFVVHADGTRVEAKPGTLIFQGDVIETSKTGAVNITFADNTTFAISESARMSVDQFVYHSAEHTGSSFFSMLQGAFVYTSGLIGKTDPGSVNIETPVGSIGIRGTVVAGHIAPAGQDSQITILDGAITVTNSVGTQEMNTSLATVSLNSYQSQAQSVPMDAKTFNESYHSVSAVAGDTISHFTGIAPSPSAPTGGEQPAQQHEGQAAPTNGTVAPAATAPAPAAPAAAPTQGSTTQSTTQEAVATTPAASTPTPTAADSAVTVIAAAPAPADSSASSFGGTGSAAGSSTFGGTTSTTSFGGGTAASSSGSAAGTTGGGTTAAGQSSGTTSTGTAGTTTTTTSPPPALNVALAVDTGLSSNDHVTNDGRVVLSGLGVGATAQYSSDGINWSSTAPAVTQGVNNLYVRQTSAGGVISAPVTFTFTYDTSAPATMGVSLLNDTGSSNADKVTNNAAFTFTGKETSAVVEYSANGTSGWSTAVPSWQQGANTVYVRQTDVAGNSSAGTLFNFTYDSAATAPIVALSADTGSNATDRVTSNGALSVTGTESGATIEYSTNGTTWSTTAPTATEGANTVYVRQTDTAGNVSASSGVNFTLDTQAPVLNPVSFVDNRSGNPVTTGTVVTYTITFNENIDPASLPSTTSFSNAGSATITVNNVTLATSNSIQVQVTVTGPGSLQLQENTGGSVKDLAGNRLTLASAIADNTTLAGFGLNFSPSAAYNNTTVGGTGIGEFSAIGTLVGTAAAVNALGTMTWSIAVDGASSPQVIVPTNTAAGTYTLQSLNLANAFTIDAAGNIYVNNPLALSHLVNAGGLTLNITGTDSVTGNSMTLQAAVDIKDYLNGATPLVANSAAGNAILSQSGTGVADFIYANDLSSASTLGIFGYGGADVLIGGIGNNVINIADGLYKYIDGGAGIDTLVLNSINTTYYGNSFTLDFTTATGIVRNIEKIDLGFGSVNQGNDIKINIQNVSDMTTADGSLNHTLSVGASMDAYNSTVNVDTTGTGTDFKLTSGVWGVTQDLVYTGTVGGHTVTLNVREFGTEGQSMTSSGGIVVMDNLHGTPTYNIAQTFSGTTGADFLISSNTNSNGGAANDFSNTAKYSIIAGNGGADILLGSLGDNLIKINDASFSFVDGGDGYDRLSLQTTGTNFMLDFTNLNATQHVRNFEEVDLGISTNAGTQFFGNSISLNLKDVFDMTSADVSGNHTLIIKETAGGTVAVGHEAGVNIALSSSMGTFSLFSDTTNGGTTAGDITYRGTATGGSIVTLVIHEASAVGAVDHIGVVAA